MGTQITYLATQPRQAEGAAASQHLASSHLFHFILFFACHSEINKGHHCSPSYSTELHHSVRPLSSEHGDESGGGVGEGRAARTEGGRARRGEEKPWKNNARSYILSEGEAAV